MNKTLVMGAVLAAASFGAAAQPDYGAYRDSQIQAQQQYQAPQPGSEHYNPELDPRSPQYNANNVPPGHAYANDPQRSQYQSVSPGYEYDRQARVFGQRFRAGGYAPQFRSEQYWVRDWRARRLDRPPQGYRWVQADNGEVLLMAQDSGRIARVIGRR
ncbi:RcnB family protein [Ramlibacter sp. PS4R-6]|uniref:RcnB family protein n=1 Tax=Ramlibacter sp. PS4R-6 TaxID=3133438 RepID=UPI00309A1905